MLAVAVAVAVSIANVCGARDALLMAVDFGRKLYHVCQKENCVAARRAVTSVS